MFLDGNITDIGDLPQGRGVSITLADTQTIHIVGLTEEQTRQIGRMMYHRVTVKIESQDDRARFRDEDPPPPGHSNIDEATGIKKSGEI